MGSAYSKGAAAVGIHYFPILKVAEYLNLYICPHSFSNEELLQGS